MARKTTHVVPNPKGGWNVKQGGAKRASSHHNRKSDAVNSARPLSRRQKSELIIHNRDGRFGRADSHGGDPHPPKG